MRREIEVTSRQVEPVGRSVAADGAGRPPSAGGRTFDPPDLLRTAVLLGAPKLH